MLADVCTWAVSSQTIKVLSAEAMKPVLDALVSEFERVSRNLVTVGYAPAGVIANRMRSGEPADLVIVPKLVFDALVTEGRIATGSATKIAQSVLAVAVAAGAPKPDISTVEAFKCTLLNARSITYPDPKKGGAIGIEAARVIDRLGLTNRLKPKTTLTSAGEFRGVLARRQAELAIVQPIVVIDCAGIDLVGPLPCELQPRAALAFLAGIGTDAKEPAAADALRQYLASPAAAQLFEAKGMLPCDGSGREA